MEYIQPLPTLATVCSVGVSGVLAGQHLIVRSSDEIYKMRPGLGWLEADKERDRDRERDRAEEDLRREFSWFHESDRT